MADTAGLKVPPHSIDAERSFLGSLLLDQDAIVQVADLVDKDDFYHKAHTMIYETIMDLFNRKSPIDLLTVSSLLKDRGQLDTIGGNAYLAEITDAVVSAAHVYQYGVIIKHKATLRKIIHAGDVIKGLGYQEDEDIENILEEAEKNLFGVSQTFVKDKFVHVKEILTKTYEKITDLHDPEAREKYVGVPLGFSGIDNILSGLQPSDLVILAARPAMGKTALALNIAQNIARRGLSIGLMSLEMSKEQLVERMFCSVLQVDSWKMKTGQLTENDFARIGPVMDEINQYKIFIDDSLGNSLPELRAKARRLQMEHGLDLLVIDYLQLMTSGKGGASFSNRVNEISEISRSLKALARELHIPIIALSQLSRAVEQRPNKIPVLSDLRESGAIEQDADVVMMMYREDYYEEDSDRPGITDIYIRKHRHGKTGRVELMFKKEHMRFYDLDLKHSAP